MTQAEIDAILNKINTAVASRYPQHAPAVSGFVLGKRGRPSAAPSYTGTEELRGAYGSMVLRMILGTSPQMSETQRDRFLTEAASLADGMLAAEE